MILLDFLKDIKSNSLIICNNQDKLQILNYLSNNSMFLNLKFFNPYQPLAIFSKDYNFYMMKHFSVSPNLSDRIKRYFDYIMIEEVYDNPRIEKLKQFKAALIRDDILTETKINTSYVYSINEMFVPKFIDKPVKNYNIERNFTNQILLVKAKDIEEQIRFTYEKVIELIESGVNLENIHILNSTSEEDLQFKKIFNDARINYNINKSISISTYQITLKLIKILRESGYHSALDYLKLQEPSDILNKLIRLFNSYDSSLIQDDLDTFIYELNKVKFSSSGFSEAINISSFDNILVNDNDYYILLNYYDEVFPKKYLDNDYLSNEEASRINFPSSLQLNKNTKIQVTKKLNSIKNLIIAYPEKVIDDTIKSRIILERPVIEIEYKKKISLTSYLPSLDLLEYAKDIFNYENYRIKSDKLELLNNTFRDNLHRFIPQFSGINPETLKLLLKRNNTLSGAKIETYNLCPFRYFLNYLLKLDDFSDNIFTFIGNVIHKSLELRLTNKDFKIIEILKQYNFPENEEYKFRLFSEIVIENVEVITEIVTQFENSSLFKKIYTETKINQKFDELFFLSGYIDKVMIDEEKNYLLVVDYKYSDKDFTLDEFNKGYKLQLPFYLLACQDMFPEKEPIGLLYQRTSLEKKEKDKNSDFKMKGIILNQDEVIKRIDPSIDSIKGLKAKKDGSVSKTQSSVISNEDMSLLLGKTRDFISNAAEEIKSGNFIIKPIVHEISQRSQDSISCEYCSFFSICYSKNKLLGGER